MKHNIEKRLLALLLALCLLMGALPLSASAAETGTPVTSSAGLTAAIVAGGKVTLGGDFTVETEGSIAAFTIGEGKSVTLDLKGHTLTVPETVRYLFQVEAGGSLIIEDSDTGGTITAEETTEKGSTTSATPVSMTEGEFWLKSGALTSANSAVQIAINATGASFLMTGGKLEHTASVGSALSLRGSGNVAVLTGGTITSSGNNALYLDNASCAYLGGDVTTDGIISNTRGALTVTGRTHKDRVFSGSSYNPTTKIYGGTFNGVSQNKYGTLELYGGMFYPPRS